MMNVQMWLLLGFLAGVIAMMINPKLINRGILGALLLGVIGSVTGGLLSSMIITTTGMASLQLTTVIAVLGAVGLLTIQNKI